MTYNVFILFLIPFCLSQFTVRYVKETTGWRSRFPECSSYCNTTNAECWYPITVTTNIEQIVVQKFTPGLCVCYSGFGGPNCSDDIRALQNSTGVYRNFGCTYKARQISRAENGSNVLYEDCPCALGYQGLNCSSLITCPLPGDCNPGSSETPKGFCMADLRHQPTCFCNGDWTGRNCELYFPTWIRSVKDAIGYVILNIAFIFLLIPAHIVCILVCLPPKGKSCSDVNKLTFTLKLLSAIFILVTLYLKAIGSIAEWAWDYQNIVTIFFYLVGIILNISAFFLMITLWSQLKDISTRNEKWIKIKFGIGITVVIIQFALAVVFFIPYLVVYGLAYLGISSNEVPQWFTLAFSMFLFVEFFFVGLGFLFFGLRTFVDLKKVDKDLKFESLKFTQFMTAICVVFASQGVWTFILGLDTVCKCMGGTSYFCFLIIQIHEFVYMSLFLYLLFDIKHFKAYFCPCIKKNESD